MVDSQCDNVGAGKQIYRLLHSQSAVSEKERAGV